MPKWRLDDFMVSTTELVLRDAVLGDECVLAIPEGLKNEVVTIIGREVVYDPVRKKYKKRTVLSLVEKERNMTMKMWRLEQFMQGTKELVLRDKVTGSEYVLANHEQLDWVPVTVGGRDMVYDPPTKKYKDRTILNLELRPEADGEPGTLQKGTE